MAAAVQDVSNPLDEENISYQAHLRTITELRSLLIKASDMVDNPGSLIHQYTQVKDSFIEPKVIKYTPAVPVIRAALLGYESNTGVIQMIQALDLVSANLATLAGYFDLDI